MVPGLVDRTLCLQGYLNVMWAQQVGWGHAGSLGQKAGMVSGPAASSGYGWDAEPGSVLCCPHQAVGLTQAFTGSLAVLPGKRAGLAAAGRSHMGFLRWGVS